MKTYRITFEDGTFFHGETYGEMVTEIIQRYSLLFVIWSYADKKAGHWMIDGKLEMVRNYIH
jgi:hypothetical protein